MPTERPKAAKPTREIFDPFNSTATGHQRAENRLSGSTLWRDSRHTKLREQFTSGAGGGKRVSDTVGAGSNGALDMGLTEAGTVTWKRAKGQKSLDDSVEIDDGDERAKKRARLEAPSPVVIPTCAVESTTPFAKRNSRTNTSLNNPSPSMLLSPIDPASSGSDIQQVKPEDDMDDVRKGTPPPQIFKPLTFYVNGLTAPAISDHKLKQVLAKHGGHISISLGRRSVTHVIISRPSSNGGSGGGLSGSEIHKEVSRKRGESVKYVTAEWVLESIKAGKRLPESKFEALRMAPKGMGSVKSIFGVIAKPANGGAEKNGKG